MHVRFFIIALRYLEAMYYLESVYDHENALPLSSNVRVSISDAFRAGLYARKLQLTSLGIEYWVSILWCSVQSC